MFVPEVRPASGKVGTRAGQDPGNALEVQRCATHASSHLRVLLSSHIATTGAEGMGDDSRSRSRSHSRTPSRMDLSVHSEVTKKHLLKLADKSVRVVVIFIVMIDCSTA